MFLSFGNISFKDACFLLKVIKLNVTCLFKIKQTQSQQQHLRTSTAMFPWTTVLVCFVEEEHHHYCCGGEEVSAQICDWPQGKHPARDSGSNWCLGWDPTFWQQLRNCHPSWWAGPSGSGSHWSLRQGTITFWWPQTLVMVWAYGERGVTNTHFLPQANSYTVSSVSAPSWLHRFIIGKKGQNLAKITQQMPKVCSVFLTKIDWKQLFSTSF